MNAGTLNRRISDTVVGIGEALVAELREESPLFRAIENGTVEREAYGRWLIQQYKYMTWTHELLCDYAKGVAHRGSPRMRAIGTGAARHAEEEKGHDEHVLDDIATIHGISREAAIALVERTETAPAVHLYGSIARTIVAQCPAAFAGFAMAIEVLAGTLSCAAREAMLRNRPFEGVEDAIRIFADHEEDGIHVDGGRFRVDNLEDPSERVASVLGARLLRDVYRGLFAHLDAQVGDETAFVLEVAARS